MIRLPATRIELSEGDIQFHLQNIALKHSLRKAGYDQMDFDKTSPRPALYTTTDGSITPTVRMRYLSIAPANTSSSIQGGIVEPQRYPRNSRAWNSFVAQALRTHGADKAVRKTPVPNPVADLVRYHPESILGSGHGELVTGRMDNLNSPMNRGQFRDIDVEDGSSFDGANEGAEPVRSYHKLQTSPEVPSESPGNLRSESLSPFPPSYSEDTLWRIREQNRDRKQDPHPSFAEENEASTHLRVTRGGNLKVVRNTSSMRACVDTTQGEDIVDSDSEQSFNSPHMNTHRLQSSNIRQSSLLRFSQTSIPSSPENAFEGFQVHTIDSDATSPTTQPARSSPVAQNTPSSRPPSTVALDASPTHPCSPAPSLQAVNPSLSPPPSILSPTDSELSGRFARASTLPVYIDNSHGNQPQTPTALDRDPQAAVMRLAHRMAGRVPAHPPTPSNRRPEQESDEENAPNA